MANPGYLVISNQSPWYVTYYVPISDGWWNCCDAPQRGFAVVSVPPNVQSTPFMFVRTDGHGCNGRQGQFAMVPTLPDRVASPQQFWFDSNGGLAFQGPNPNYISQLTQNPGGVYVWTVGSK